MARVITDRRCSVSLADLRSRHTIRDLKTYVEALDFADERDREVED